LPWAFFSAPLGLKKGDQQSVSRTLCHPSNAMSKYNVTGQKSKKRLHYMQVK